LVQPRYASTVVLVRADDSGSFEILLTRRPPQMKFLGGFYVFPGGTVHQSDYSSKVLQQCSGISGGDARKILGGRCDESIALGHWVAGIREVFEEVGVLLCVTESGGDIGPRDPATEMRFEKSRQAIVREQLDFGSFLESEGLFCDLSRATYFFHRVTPEVYPLRFDTRFYLSPLPLNQTPLLRSEEVTDSLWIKPAEALARIYRDKFPLLPPTTTVLDDLSQVASWERLCAQFNLR